MTLDPIEGRGKLIELAWVIHASTMAQHGSLCPDRSCCSMQFAGMRRKREFALLPVQQAMNLHNR